MFIILLWALIRNLNLEYLMILIINLDFIVMMLKSREFH
nr:MAG TPA: hypothetical protein [Crassvirales sp.]DAO31194.1 MAG TPA: hypothetical protein [Crassvirales sp.]